MRTLAVPALALAIGLSQATPGAAATPGKVPVVRDGKAVAVVVLADRPTAVARYAAQELVYHVERATGAKLAVVTEGEAPPAGTPRIYVGDCAATRAARIDVKSLSPEAFTLRAADAALTIAGDDGGGDPLDPDVRAGTLFGVYEWLGRDLGVRWLWPGELGTVVPRAGTIVAQPVDATVTPPFAQRRVRPGLGFTSDHPALGFTAKAAEQ
jgi:hypothetical protein